MLSLQYIYIVIIHQLYMAKLSQQLQEKRGMIQTRPTRTERVLHRQVQEKKYTEELKKFEELKQQAKKIQEEKFKDQIIKEEYTEEVPNWDKIPARFQRSWDEKSGTQKSNLIKGWRKEGKTKIVKSTRDKTIPFTLESGEHSYKGIYEGLSPDLQTFFSTPEKVLEDKTIRIKETKQTIQDKRSFADEKLKEAKEKHDKNLKSNQEWFLRKKGDQRKEARENYSKNEDDINDDYDEARAKWQGYKEGLSKGLSELKSNKDISITEIERYAWEIADYEENKQRARNEKKAYERKQKDQIKKLEEKGYVPYMIEKSFKGKPKDVTLSYYNVKTGDWEDVSKYKIKSEVDVSKLKKIGYSAPQERKLEFAGKEYKFTSKIPIYKTAKGEIVTPYEKTGVTEQQLIKQQQDLAITKWEKERAIKPFYEKIEEKALISKVKDQRKWYEKTPQELFIKPAKKKVVEGTKWIATKGFDFIKGSPFYVKPPKVSAFRIGIGGITLLEKDYFTGKEYLKVEDITSKIKKDLSGWKSQTYGEMLKVKDVGKLVEDEIQKEQQLRFEDIYYKKLIKEEITPEKAEKEFRESETAKYLEEKYQTRIKEETIKQFSWKTKAGYGLKLAGISALQLGVKVIPETTGEAGLTTIGGITGYKALSKIPPHVTRITMGSLGTYGVYKTISPLSTPEEVGSGIIMAGVTGLTFGYGSYKYLRSSHKIATVKIPAPRIPLKTTAIVGRDIKLILKQGTAERIVFDTQKLSQSAQAGQRTIWTTKGRYLLGKYTKLKISPIYKGVPTKQLGKAYKISSLRGDYWLREKSGYQKMYDIFRKYDKYTHQQAISSLRYYSPRVTEQILQRGYLIPKGDKAIGQFTYSTRKPIIDIDKTLGIKTRGGKIIEDVTQVKRKLIDFEKSKIVLEEQKKLSLIIDKQGRIVNLKKIGFEKGIIGGETSELKKGYDVFKGKGYTVFEQAQYKDIIGKSISQSLDISGGKYSFKFDLIKKMEASQTHLFNKIIDLSKIKSKVPISIKKTPLSKTFGEEIKLKEIIKEYKQPSTIKDFKKVMDKLEQPSTREISKYWGTGKYERTDAIGGFSLKEMPQALKTGIMPDPIKAFKIKEIINAKQFKSLTGLNLAPLTAVKLATDLKTDTKLKSQLKVGYNLKGLLKEDVILKVQQIPALKQPTTLKTQLKSLLDFKPLSPAITTPIIIRPNIPIIPEPPIPKPFIIPFLKAKILKAKRKGFEKGIYEKAYLPDFTSRALGLTPVKISEKQAQKKLKKLLTGLEIRRGVIIK